MPAFAYALRAIFANAPNSVLPERVFSILNDTFDDVQDHALADYIELSLQLYCSCSLTTGRARRHR